MRYQSLNKVVARLILLQRVELISPLLKRFRKIFGRYIFTNFISKFFLSADRINKEYYSLMSKEFENLSRYLNFDGKKILSIGSGVCGLELIINSKTKNSFFTIIEKDYISKKVVYGWDTKNEEAYNNLDILRTFIINNGMKNNYEIFNYDQDNLPIKKFDYIISLYSMDYHYDYLIYYDYFKKVVNDDTKIIFDTIRPDYFKTIFENVDIIHSDEKEIHSSKRVICSKFLN